MVQIYQPEDVVGNEADHRDGSEAQALQMGPEVLLESARPLVLSVEDAHGVGLEGHQHRGHHYDHYANDVVQHLAFKLDVTAEVKAMRGVLRAAVHFAIVKVYDAWENQEHQHPHHNADEDGVDPVEGDLALRPAVERDQAQDQDDHVEDERHVHVDVDHGTDHPAPPTAHVPVIGGMVVNPEGHGEEEDEVGEDEVQHSNGGTGGDAGLHHVHHQAQANGAAEQDHGVDGQESGVVLADV